MGGGGGRYGDILPHKVTNLVKLKSPVQSVMVVTLWSCTVTLWDFSNQACIYIYMSDSLNLKIWLAVISFFWFTAGGRQTLQNHPRQWERDHHLLFLHGQELQEQVRPEGIRLGDKLGGVSGPTLWPRCVGLFSLLGIQRKQRTMWGRACVEKEPWCQTVWCWACHTYNVNFWLAWKRCLLV